MHLLPPATSHIEIPNSLFKISFWRLKRNVLVFQLALWLICLTLISHIFSDWYLFLTQSSLKPLFLLVVWNCAAWNWINTTKTMVVIFDSTLVFRDRLDSMVVTSTIICTLLKIGCAQLDIVGRWNIRFVLAVPRVFNNIFISSFSQVASGGAELCLDGWV